MNCSQTSAQFKFRISIRFFHCRLNRSGLRCRKAARKPVLSQETRRARLAFALANVGRPLAYWRRVIFSDEKTFRSDANGAVRVWREAGTR